MTTKDTQVRKLMEEMTKHGEVGLGSLRSGMDRKTGRKYVKAGKLPSELAVPRDWKTRDDPFEEDWPKILELLRVSPDLEAKAIFDHLSETDPGRHDPGQLRTLQRRLRNWRAEQGPEKEIFFRQAHRPGEAAQTDFTEASSLHVTIGGVAFRHLLCVFVLPFSNWLWATVCQSESMAAIRKGVQAAIFQLGRIPRFHQTDHSTAATHRISKEKAAEEEQRKRPFNEEYLALMRHFGMTPRTTEVGAKEQNGDVEASNGALKRRLEQALLLRGNREFESVSAWQVFIQEVVRKANLTRGERITEELSVMREIAVDKLPEFKEEQVLVNSGSTIRVQQCAYSVPSRLIGEMVKVRVFEDRIEVYYAGKQQLSCERLRGKNQHRIDYRHVVWSLVRKPGAFARYVYREEMFPSLVFRRAFDALQARNAGFAGDLEYLRVLHLAASTMESEVQAALELLLGEKKNLSIEAVKALVNGQNAVVPEVNCEPVDLRCYDTLLEEVGT